MNCTGEMQFIILTENALAGIPISNKYVRSLSASLSRDLEREREKERERDESTQTRHRKMYLEKRTYFL